MDVSFDITSFGARTAMKRGKEMKDSEKDVPWLVSSSLAVSLSGWPSSDSKANECVLREGG